MAGLIRRRSAVIIATIALAATYSGVLLGGPTAASTRPADGRAGAPGRIPALLRAPLRHAFSSAPANRTTTTTSPPGALGGVAAVSATDAWTVGSTSTGVTVILHWNGTAWTRVASPAPSGGADLQGVAATSASNAWAVGYSGGSTPEPVILAWNGTAWSQVPAPAISGGGYLEAVTATSAANAWAVGYTTAGATLILQWNGSVWTQVPSPTPAGTFATLYGVTATSVTSVYAVGGSGSSAASPNNTLILYWNGASWTQVASPTPAAGGVLTSVAEISVGGLWAVGYSNGNPSQPLILDLGPFGWEQYPSPVLPHGGGLDSVVATSSSGAWAAGFTTNQYNKPITLILQLNGSTWKRVASPHPGTDSALSGIAAFGNEAWAVGVVGAFKNSTLVEQWNGTGWTSVLPVAPAQGPSASPRSAGTAPRNSLRSSTVTLSGPVSCAGLFPAPGLYYKNYLAARVRFQTASGAAADATISNGLAYTVQLTGVPSGGETAIAYITCGTDPTNNPSWGCQFTLTQSTTYLDLLVHLFAGNWLNSAGFCIAPNPAAK